MSGVRCPRRNCGAQLVAVTDGNGNVGLVCEPCARNRRGLCRDCPKRIPKTPNRMRCDACQARHAREMRIAQSRAAYADPERRAQKLARQREYRQQPEVKARQRAFQRAWLKRNPGYGSWATMKSLRTNSVSRTKHNARQRRYYERSRDMRVAYMREYYQRTKAQRLVYQRAYRERQRAERQQRRTA